MVPAGDPIENYYPMIVDKDLFNRVQEIRSGSFARGLVQVGKYHGNGRVSWKNLFGIHVNTLRKWVRLGKFPRIPLPGKGKDFRFSKELIYEWAKNRAVRG